MSTNTTEYPLFNTYGSLDEPQPDIFVNPNLEELRISGLTGANPFYNSQMYCCEEESHSDGFTNNKTVMSHSISVMSHQTHVPLIPQICKLTDAKTMSISHPDLSSLSVQTSQNQLTTHVESLDINKKRRLPPYSACMMCKAAKRKCDVVRPCNRCLRNELSCIMA